MRIWSVNVYWRDTNSLSLAIVRMRKDLYTHKELTIRIEEDFTTFNLPDVAISRRGADVKHVGGVNRGRASHAQAFQHSNYR